MEPFTTHKGIAVALTRTDIDTDQIIPKQFLKLIGKTGFGQYLFYDWRFDDKGQARPDFTLNQAPFKGASILVAGDNFGCGSSREHAAWSISDFGIRVIISTSFADIFWNNSFKNGLLPIKVSAEQLQKLFAIITEKPGVSFSVDLAAQTINAADFIINFDIDQRRKEFLLKGLDDIKYTMQFSAKIEEFEAKQKRSQPWAWAANS